MHRPTLPALLVGLALTSPVVALADQAALLDELRGIVEKARQERAADRWLQRALDDLLARHDNPWKQGILFEDFRDGDYTRNPDWQVISGDFRVVRGQGLVGSPIAATAPTPTAPDDAEQSPADALGGLIIGAILDQALGPQDTPPRDGEASGTPSAPGEIRVEAGVGNAFAIEFSFRATAGSDFDLALLQSEAGRYGYRLGVSAGERGGIELQRIRRGNGAVVEGQTLGQPIDDGRLHDLRWEQGPDGTVTVALDGETLFSVRDRAFRDPYPWLHLRIGDGEVTVRSLRISGA